jgi:hypothetical protein
MEVPKCAELRTQPNAKKVDLANFILKYEDAIKIICDEKLKRSRNFGDIGKLRRYWAGYIGRTI